jgi:hypothetical protein
MGLVLVLMAEAGPVMEAECPQLFQAQFQRSMESRIQNIYCEGLISAQETSFLPTTNLKFDMEHIKEAKLDCAK